jgi:hypothetical protein
VAIQLPLVPLTGIVMETESDEQSNQSSVSLQRKWLMQQKSEVDAAIRALQEYRRLTARRRAREMTKRKKELESQRRWSGLVG